MKEESGKQASVNAQMLKLLRKRDRDFAQLQEESAGAQAKAVHLALENQRLSEQVPYHHSGLFQTSCNNNSLVHPLVIQL